MQDSQKVIQLLDLLIEDINNIKETIEEIESARLALKWMEEAKKEKK